MEWYLWVLIGYVVSALLTWLFYVSLGYVKEHEKRGDTKKRAILELILISLFQPVGIALTIYFTLWIAYENFKLIVYKITHK